MQIKQQQNQNQIEYDIVLKEEKSMTSNKLTLPRNFVKMNDMKLKNMKSHQDKRK